MASPKTKFDGLRMNIGSNVTWGNAILLGRLELLQPCVLANAVFSTFENMSTRAWRQEHVVQCQDMAYWVYWTLVLLSKENKGLNTTAIIVLVCLPVTLHGHVAKMQRSGNPLQNTNFVDFELGCATTLHQDNCHWPAWKRSTNFSFSQTIFF